MPRGATNPILDQLRRQVRSHPDDADALYRLSVVLINPGEQRRPTKKKCVRTREFLERVVQLRRGFADAHALLAYVLLELDDPKAALLSLRQAVDLYPDNETYQDFFLETLDRTGRDLDLRKYLERTAKLRRIDLASLRDELRAAGLPTDSSTIRLNAFPAGEQRFVSRLVDEVEAIEREYSIGGTNNGEIAQAARRSVTIDARRVPADLRSVVYLARKWGVADDADRSSLIDRASADERAEMQEVLSAQMRRRINEWIDSFPDSSLITMEASHFMYLLEAYEEML